MAKPLDRLGRSPQLGLGNFQRLLGEPDPHVVRRLCAGDFVLRLGRVGRQPRHLVVDLRKQFALLHPLSFAHGHGRDDARLLRRHLGFFQQPQHDRFDFDAGRRRSAPLVGNDSLSRRDRCAAIVTRMHHASVIAATYTQLNLVP